MKRSRPHHVSEDVENTTEVKLATLQSLHPTACLDVILECLLSANGSVDRASEILEAKADERPSKKVAGGLSPGNHQSSLASFGLFKHEPQSSRKQLTRRGHTLHLYTPEEVAINTPCSIIHNFLPSKDADALLRELVNEARSFSSDEFQMFDKTVKSPHTSAFYMENGHEVAKEKHEYAYNGTYLSDIRESTPEMRKTSVKVRDAVNAEIRLRIANFYSGGKKLKHQSPQTWVPNTAFVNCYDGGAESVGYHSDQLTQLGPRAVIGSLSLGVEREFRVRKIVPRDAPGNTARTVPDADAEGQIAIHLPHNSLLVMHAEMQEEWKHSIPAVQTVEPHPISGNKRLNITYRWYRESFHPSKTPKCKCGIPAVLRCVQRKVDNRGRYMWQCHRHFHPGQKGCSHFEWAEFDDDGEPLRKDKKL